jgi:quinol monooxygenase YgiN
MSVIMVATVFPAPDRRAEVVKDLEAAIARVHEEPGCELYALHQGRDRLVMIEKWASQEALAEHGKSPTVAELHAVLDGKLIADLDIQMLTPHPAGTARQGAL